MKISNSRTQNTTQNIIIGYIGNIITMLLHFISRTIFVYTIGVSYLGINGLFSSILGMLSLTELGIGTAINYTLYKPVAEKNISKIIVLMKLYKKAYTVIALVITAIGLAILPFLPYMINDVDNIPNATIYYLIFLFNTVSSYFISYKYGLVNAEQKGYIINGLNSIFTTIITIVQSIVLIVFKNYLMYLIVQAVLQLIQKVFIGLYLNRHYPYLNQPCDEKLSKEELKKIKKNVIALMMHKIGEISIYQTDNIIISTFISVIVVGKISNYNLIITSVTTFITIIFNSVTASMGNLIALESKQKQKYIFEVYNFLGFWMYGFSAICYWVLFTPFISLWIGEANLIDDLSLGLIIIAQYLTGQRLTVNNMKTAGGIFEEDKYVSLVQGAINLIVSLIAVYFWGLPGVYVGTVISGLYANIIRPIIVYRVMFQTSATEYFKKFFIYFSVTTVTGIFLKVGLLPMFVKLNWLTFFIMFFITVVAVNVIFFLCFWKSKEFKDIEKRIKSIITFKKKV